MLKVTPEQCEKFKQICDNKFVGNKDFIIVISLVNNRSDLIEALLLNSISFNYIIDNDSVVETVPIGWQTNGSYRNIQNDYSNAYTKCINFGIVVGDDIKDVDGAMRQLKNTIGMIAYKSSMRLVVGDTVQLNPTKDPNSIIYKHVPDDYIVDVTFKYFRQLFK